MVDECEARVAQCAREIAGDQDRFRTETIEQRTRRGRYDRRRAHDRRQHQPRGRRWEAAGLVQVDDLEGKDQSSADVVDRGPSLNNDDRPRQARPPAGEHTSERPAHLRPAVGCFPVRACDSHVHRRPRRRRSRTADATRAADADDSIVNLPGSFPAAAARSGGRIVRAVGSAYTAALGNWAPASRPVRAVGGVYTGRRYDAWCGRKERTMVTADRLSRARAGDGQAFRELAESHRRELQVHCYRMLGSFADAEDAVQETMLAAWQGIGGFTEERASLRTWLYKIATSRCLNARRAASRRPAREWDMSQFK